MAATLDNCLIATDSTPNDSRGNLLCQHERLSFTVGEAWRLLAKNWHFIARHRRFVTLKCVLTFTSLTFFLLTPWPMKIIIDNVIDDRPLTGIPAAVLTPIAGESRSAMLIVVLAFLTVCAFLIGMLGRGEEARITTATQHGGSNSKHPWNYSLAPGTVTDVYACHPRTNPVAQRRTADHWSAQG
jgi:hypothetical protein